MTHSQIIIIDWIYRDAREFAAIQGSAMAGAMSGSEKTPHLVKRREIIALHYTIHYTIHHCDGEFLHARELRPCLLEELFVVIICE